MGNFFFAGMNMRKYVFIILSFLLCLPLFGYDEHLTIPEGLLASSGIDPLFIAKFAFFLALLILWTSLFSKILKMLLNIPIIAGQIIAGLFLGPSFFDIKSLSLFADPLLTFDKSTGALYAIASSDIFIIFILILSAAFTVPYLLWIAGHETDIKDIIKVGFTAVTAGILGAAVPVSLTAVVLFYVLGSYFTVAEAIGLGLIFSATSVSIPVAMLFARNKMHLRSSKATLGAAIVDDILAVILLSVFFILIKSCILIAPIDTTSAMHTHCTGIVSSVVYMIVSFAVIFTAGYYVIPPMVSLLKEKSQTHLIASVANGIMWLYFAFAELIGGLAGITGSYFAGLFHRMGDRKSAAEKVISPFVNAILLPLFLGSIGLRLDITVLKAFDWVIVILLLFVAILSKMLACYVATFLSNLYRRKSKSTWKNVDSYLFGSSMVARGEVGLVIATIISGAGVISQQQYVISVVVIILTTIASPIMLSVGFYWLEKIEKKQRIKYKDVILKLGRFDVMGTFQMFNIILGRIDASEAFTKSTLIFSEGRRIANLEKHNVKIIYSPEEGIMFEGNEKEIKKILKLVKKSIMIDLEQVY